MPGKREGVCLQTPERGGGAEVLEMTKRKDRWAPVANPTQGFLRERFRDLVVSRNGSEITTCLGRAPSRAFSEHVTTEAHVPVTLLSGQRVNTCTKRLA